MSLGSTGKKLILYGNSLVLGERYKIAYAIRECNFHDHIFFFADCSNCNTTPHGRNTERCYFLTNLQFESVLFFRMKIVFQKSTTSNRPLPLKLWAQYLYPMQIRRYLQRIVVLWSVREELATLADGNLAVVIVLPKCVCFAADDGLQMTADSFCPPFRRSDKSASPEWCHVPLSDALIGCGCRGFSSMPSKREVIQDPSEISLRRYSYKILVSPPGVRQQKTWQQFSPPEDYFTCDWYPS